MTGSSQKSFEHPVQESGEVNPLKSDSELQDLLKQLNKFKKYKKFQRWKKTFLERLEHLLSEEGLCPAEQACDNFHALLKKAVSMNIKVKCFIEKGDLGDHKKTVRASLALNEMCNSLTKVVDEIKGLIPSNSKEEKKYGFTKFHLGAALIRQGFHQYIMMKSIEDAVEEIGSKLENVADRQHHDLFGEYALQVQRFCDIMADLNLYDVMIKCLHFAEAPEEEESSTEESVLVEIFITSEDGKTLRLELDPSETIGNIKDAIAGTCKIIAGNQLLKFGDEIMNDNNASLEGIGIEDGSTLTVESVKVPITVTTMDGKQIQLMIDPTKTLSDIKSQLEGEAGLSRNNQRIFMDGEELLDNNKTGEDYGIKAGEKLYLEPKAIQITVEMPDRQINIIEVAPSDTRGIIKEKIAKKTGMAEPRQVLKFNGKEIASNETVKDLDIQDGSIVSVEVYKVPITVTTMDGKEIDVLVDPTETLDNIKRQLENDSSLPVHNQKLSMDSNELLDDNKAIASYGIKAGSELDLEPKFIKISVELPSGKTFKLDITLSHTSDKIKAAIAEETGIAASRQVLKFEGKELTNGGKATVRDMDIREGSVLNLEINRLPITVKTKDGKTISLEVEPSDTISAIKTVIQKETNLKPEKQCLKLGSKELTDSCGTAESSGIKEGSILTLEPRTDPIIFVDIKCSSLFAVDRDFVIDRQVLTPIDNSKLEFMEEAKDCVARDKLFFTMKNSPNLGVATQVVVEKTDVENYEVTDAARVKDMWGVDLKKREKNKKGEELIYIDPNTGAAGELSRKKCIDMKFITPVATQKGETLKENENDHMKYDKYISDIRNVFSLKGHN